MDGIDIVVEPEASLDVEWLAVSDGKHMGVKEAQNVERWKAHQSFHPIRDNLRDAFMLPYQRSV